MKSTNAAACSMDPSIVATTCKSESTRSRSKRSRRSLEKRYDQAATRKLSFDDNDDGICNMIIEIPTSEGAPKSPGSSRKSLSVLSDLSPRERRRHQENAIRAAEMHLSSSRRSRSEESYHYGDFQLDNKAKEELKASMDCIFDLLGSSPPKETKRHARSLVPRTA